MEDVVGLTTWHKPTFFAFSHIRRSGRHMYDTHRSSRQDREIQFDRDRCLKLSHFWQTCGRLVRRSFTNSSRMSFLSSQSGWGVPVDEGHVAIRERQWTSHDHRSYVGRHLMTLRGPLRILKNRSREQYRSGEKKLLAERVVHPDVVKGFQRSFHMYRDFIR